jgi:hypothetical protein
MTLFIAFALLFHMKAGLIWYAAAFIVWLIHCHVHGVK